MNPTISIYIINELGKGVNGPTSSGVWNSTILHRVEFIALLLNKKTLRVTVLQLRQTVDHSFINYFVFTYILYDKNL
jgi:hypothetical protein